MCYNSDCRPLGLLFLGGDHIKREEKNAQSRQRILEAAMREFSAKGYDAASLNTICAENDISKGIIYHHFKDKDELYLLCASECFVKLTTHMADETKKLGGSIEQRIGGYFHARLRFFAENPLYLGIFTDAVLDPPKQLRKAIGEIRAAFDELNASVLTGLLESVPLREGLTMSAIVEDFRMYMDFFNTRFREALHTGRPPAWVLKEHEEKCHRQVDILLYGVLK